MKKKTIVIGSAAAAGVLLIGGVAAVNATGQPGFLAAEDETLTGTTLDRASEAALAETGGGKVTDAERGDDRDDAAYEIEVTRDNGEQFDVYLDSHYNVRDVEYDHPEGAYDDGDRDDSDGDDGADRDDDMLSGTTLDKAGSAATDATGGGKVIDAEHSDDRGGAYEVSVLLDNGDEVDVYLDSDFAVIGKDYDDSDEDHGDDD